MINNSYSYYDVYKKIAWLALIICFGLIFFLSSQPDYQSRKLSNPITNLASKVISKINPDIKIKTKTLNSIIRKNGHFLIYLVLGMLVANLFNIRTALIVCLLFSISDEVHQAFVPGRGPGVLDVFIDMAGASIGIFVFKKYFRSQLSKKV